MASRSSPVIIVIVAAAVIMAPAARLASGDDGGYNPAAAAPFTTSDWQYGSATFYGDDSGLGADFGGACGYGATDIQSLYSTRTAALSTPLFDGAAGCGRCYELRCVDSPWCNPGSPSVIVTGTNLCPPNWALPSDGGGWCNPPRQHFDLAPPSYLLLADRVSGIVPVRFRRVPCRRSGGVRFLVQGNGYWLLLRVMNVAGAGDVCGLAVKRAGEPDCSYRSASRNWGATYQVFAALGNDKALVVRLTGCGGGGSPPANTVVVDDAIPPWWSAGLSYQGSNNFVY